MLMLLLAIVVLLLGAALLTLSHRLRGQAGLPAGRVVYSDTGTRRDLERPLISRRHGLVGKPDYLLDVRQGWRHGWRRATIPVEVKSRRRPASPHASHILQLATYCLLVEETTGHRPPHGLLRYADATLEIPYTNALRRQVLHAAEEIRRAQTARNVHRQHDEVGRCQGCGYRDACGEEALG